MSTPSPGADRGPLTLLLGGARSGKSSLAVRWARDHDGAVVFVATAEPGDAEMRERIARHRAERPAGWSTVEEPRALVTAIREAADDAFVIVDCLTLWVANLLDHAGDAAILDRTHALGDAATGRAGPTVVVSNEVGLGIVPADATTRRYRDLLAGVNATVAARAARTWLLVAGRALALGPPPARPTD